MENSDSFHIATFSPAGEAERRLRFLELFKRWPVAEKEFFLNLGLFLTPQTLSRVLFLDHLYKQIIGVQGIVIEFGCRWGQGSSLFTALRGIYEPFNRLRKIVAFDTFEGFVATSPHDHKSMEKGAYGVTAEYDRYLESVLAFQEQESPLSHIKKFEIVKGDASKTVHGYLERNPETTVALAYFDMDLYEPTKECLTAIKPLLTKGSVLGFDELNDPVCPGETTAVKEVFGLGNLRLQRFPISGRTSFAVME